MAEIPEQIAQDLSLNLDELAGQELPTEDWEEIDQLLERLDGALKAGKWEEAKEALADLEIVIPRAVTRETQQPQKTLVKSPMGQITQGLVRNLDRHLPGRRR